MMEMLKWGVAATLFATARASARRCWQGQDVVHPLQLIATQ